MDAFNEYASKIFDFLYTEFPKESEIRLSRFVGVLDDNYNPKVFTGTVAFLKREGYLVHQDIKMDGADRIYPETVLTAKGLAVLNAVPDSVQGSESIIQKIRTGIKAGGGEAGKAAMQSFIAHGVGLLVR
jgi:hypothetical protein